MKVRTRQDIKKPPIPILKKSSSYKSISAKQLFDNQHLKSLKTPTNQIPNIQQLQPHHNTQSMRSSFQQTLKQQLRRLKKKQSSAKQLPQTYQNIKEKRKSLGHQLIQQIKQLSEDEVVLTKIVVEFMESLSANTDKNIVLHFKNMLNMIFKVVRGSVKIEANEKEKEILQRKNSIKKMIINNKSMEDQYQDVVRQLKMYKQLVEEYKEKNQGLEGRLGKMKRVNGEMDDKVEVLGMEVEGLRKGKKEMEEQVKFYQGELSQSKSNLGLQTEKLHCQKVENQTLHNKNKELERQIFSLNKQLTALKSNNNNKIQQLKHQNVEYQTKYKQLLKKYSSLQLSHKQLQKTHNQGLSKQSIQNQYLNSQLSQIQLQLQQTKYKLQSLQQKHNKAIRIQAQLQAKVQTLEYEKLKLHSQLKSLYQSQQSKQSSHEDILPPPSPHFNQPKTSTAKPPKSNKKLRALEDIQQLIRKHKSSQ